MSDSDNVNSNRGQSGHLHTADVNTDKWLSVLAVGLGLTTGQARGMRLAVKEHIALQAKAYGGCTNCYGKGYATVLHYASGYDTDQDIGSKGGRVHFRQSPIKYCNCGRGQQLADVVARERRAAVSDAMTKFGLEKGVKYDIQASDTVIVITKAALQADQQRSGGKEQ